MGGPSMIQRFAYIILVILLSCSVHFSFGQSTSVNALIDRNKILIGEPIRLTLEASVPLHTNAKWFPVDSIPHFEVIEQGVIDTTTTASTVKYKQVVTITSFDSGRWSIPALALELNGKSYLIDSFPVSVAFSNFDPKQDYHDIKDILEVENPSVKYINWIVGAITLISLLAFIYFLRKSKLTANAVQPEAVSSMNPYEEAMQLLNRLKEQGLTEKGETKTYYTKLNDIIRLFIQREFVIRTMEKTNEEVLLQVKEIGLPHDELIRLAQTLRLSDTVKFAKYIPSSEDNEQSLITIRNTIELLNNNHKRAV